MKLDLFKNTSLFFLVVLISQLAYGLPNHCPQKTDGVPYNAKFHKKINTAVISRSYANSYFNMLKTMEPSVPFNYVLDGCDMRALLISKWLLEHNGIQTFRVAIEAEQGYFYPETKYAQEGLVELSRHTAAGFCVVNPESNIVEPFILDPSFFDKPVHLATWFAKFPSEPGTKIKAYYGNMYSLHPGSSRAHFLGAELQEVERLRQAFTAEQSRMRRIGEMPYGIGRSRGSYPSDYK